MALIKCYDTTGKEHTRESVDARECVKEMGWTLEPKIIELEKVVVKLTAAEKKAAKELEEAEKAKAAEQAKIDEEKRLADEKESAEKAELDKLAADLADLENKDKE